MFCCCCSQMPGRTVAPRFRRAFFFCYVFFSLFFLKNFHLCLSLMIRSSQVVYSSPQLRNSCSTNSCFNWRVSSEVWCFCTAHSLCPTQMSVWFARALFFCTFSVEGCLSRLVSDRAHLLFGSRPLVFRLICTVDFSQISKSQWLPTSETRSGNSSNLRVDTVAIIYTCNVSTSSHTEWLVELKLDGGRWTAQPDEHSAIDQSDNYSQFFRFFLNCFFKLLIFLLC